MKNNVKEMRLLGVNFSAMSQSQVKSMIRSHLSGKGQMSIFTPNPYFLVDAHKRSEIKELLNSATLLIPDGIGLVLGARLFKGQNLERFAGIECGEFILSEAERQGLRVFLLGGRIWIADKAAARLRERFPNLLICGTHHGYFEPESEEKLLQKINSARPDILIVCLGFPRQEKWISESLPKIPTARLAIGLGGSLDVWSGEKRRAPMAVRYIGCEWLWRVICEPKRMTSLYKLPLFLCLVMKESLSPLKSEKYSAYKKPN